MLSITHAILDIVTIANDNININHNTVLLFLDLKKTFKSVCHARLLSTLEHYGIKGSALTLIKSFFNKQQFIMLNGKPFKTLPNDFEVPQSSMLGLFLIPIYVNIWQMLFKTL